PKDQESLAFLAVILNSKFLDWLFRKTSTNNHVMGYEIRQFPIPDIIDENKYILSILYKILHFQKSNFTLKKNLIEEIANAYVFNLYFPSHMEELELNVMHFIEQDLEKTLQSRNFEELVTIEKEKVISQLQNTWS